MIKIFSKFKPGEKVYTLIRVPVIKTYKCELCEGKGSIEHNSIPLLCPECKGKKNTSIPYKNYTIWEPVEDPLIISSINVKYLNENQYTLRYKVGGYKRAGEHLFKTLEEAVLKANELNCALVESKSISSEQNDNISYHEIIINNKYDIGDIVYSFGRKAISDYAYRLVPIQSPLIVNGLRLTIYPEHSVFKYKVNNIQRIEDNLFSSLSEVEKSCFNKTYLNKSC